MGMFRNPAGQREVTYEAEAVKAMALTSALMRHLDRVQARLVGQAARYKRLHRYPARIYWRQEMKKTVRRLAIKLTRLLIGCSRRRY
jgi:hypothetical protein